MAYLGREPAYGSFEKQVLTADSSTTTFTLNYNVGSSSSILVSVAGVHQEPEVAYNLGSGGTQIIFTTAPTSGDTVFVIFLGVSFDIPTIGTGVVTGQNALTTGVQGADTLLIYDDSATSLKKITLDNLIIGQTALSTGVQGADTLLIFDDSATEIKKINLDDLITGQTELATVAADDDVLLIYDTSATEIKKIQKSNIATTLSYSKSTFTGDGSTVGFSINSGRAVDNVLVFVNGICLVPTVDYTIASTTLTFVTAPINGAEITVRYLPI